ncbi:MAG: FAD-binding oxidoreductase [Gemmatimonadetes bacterium]|nr:MAG: FAD-binding oxidoreductase [Gemmatimonadota bacterium]
MTYHSWGRFPPVTQQRYYPVRSQVDPVDWESIAGTVLPYGLGRSYGDSCLNEGGTLLLTTPLDHYLLFDAEQGILRCEAGVSLAEILEQIVPHGWFLPVTPGTKFVTLGGAIANDVHGKNHHRAGTFGRYVRQLELLRSDGSRWVCSPEHHPALFRATIGGLGLTGLILWAEITLKPIYSPQIEMESIKFRHLDEFFDLSAESDRDFEYTVAWVDCLSSGNSLGRGIFMRGNHSHEPAPLITRQKPKLRMPGNAPNMLLNPITIKAFNFVYYHKQRQRVKPKTTHYEPFFFPLDAVNQWNRIYGKRGFLQYQFVVPDDDPQVITGIFKRVAASGQGSFLAVLKTFGDVPPAGMMSFPQQGITLALDFPIRRNLFDLLDQIDDIIRAHHGAVYPAKDARMSATNFQAFYPQWEDFATHIDPKFSSSFWRRVTK